jgi:hypothetical protein
MWTMHVRRLSYTRSHTKLDGFLRQVSGNTHFGLTYIYAKHTLGIITILYLK